MLRAASPSNTIPLGSFQTLIVSGLTQSRVPFIIAGGQFSDNAGFTYNLTSSVLTVTGGFVGPNQRTGSVNQSLELGLNSGIGWRVGITDATLVPITDNTQDLGLSSLRPRDVFIGRNLVFGTSTLARTTVSLFDGAGAQAATILNGPVAGNPTKWVPINDNGTIRYLPAW